MEKKTSLYAGIFFISLASLVLEISLTRVLSVSKWYHFAFMVLSIALFGIGASGTFLSVFPKILERDTKKSLGLYSGLFSISVVLSFIISNNIPFDPFRISWDRMQLIYLFLYYFVLSIPFFFSGLCIATALFKLAKVAGKVYFSDLAGAGMGSLLVLFLFAPFGGGGTILVASILGGLASLLFLGDKKRASLMGLWLTVLVISLATSPPIFEINISPYKSLPTALRYPDSQLLYTEWNAFSRVDVIESPYVRYAPGLSLNFQGELPHQLGIVVDGDRLSAVTEYNAQFIDYLPMSLPYYLKENQKVLILNSGGGLGVLTALENNASVIIATEVNPIVVDVVNRYSGGLYSEKVKVEITDARSFIRKDALKYDIIELSFTDSTAASSTGVYALSENYLYTVESFEDLYNHLSNDGIISITRWLLPPPRESVRLVTIAATVLEKQGIKDPENHIAVVRSFNTITILIKRSEFTKSDIENIKKFSSERGFDLVFLPGIKPDDINRYNVFSQPYYYNIINGYFKTPEKEKFLEDYLFSISPTTDEKPFFFHFFKARKIRQTYESMGEKWQPFVEGGYLVHIVFLQALVLSFVFILLPVSVYKRRKVKGRILFYFLCLGIAFMFVEISFIQKFILFLGQPIYSISTVLSIMLVSSGVGSLFSQRLDADRKTIKSVVLAIVMLAVLYFAVLPQVFSMFLGYDLLIRRVISIVIITPIGFMMGMPFPLGIKLVNELYPRMIPWAWAVNGCASVLSSVLAIMLALSFGFSAVLALAGGIYAIALIGITE